MTKPLSPDDDAEKQRKVNQRANGRLARAQMEQGRFSETVPKARWACLNALKAAAPEAWQELQSLQPSFHQAVPFILTETWEAASQSKLPRVARVAEALTGWVQSIRFDRTRDAWVSRAAFHLLQTWEHSDAKNLMLPMDVLAPFSQTETWNSLPFELCEQYDPTRDSLKNFEKRVKATFKNELRRYIERIELEALQHGVVSSYQPQGLREGKVPQDATRLVQYQVLGKSFDAIALLETECSGEGAATETVRKGVHRYAALIGLELRQGDRGGRR